MVVDVLHTAGEVQDEADVILLTARCEYNHFDVHNEGFSKALGCVNIAVFLRTISEIVGSRAKVDYLYPFCFGF